MGKMSKKNLDELRREDPTENNWEITEEQTGDSVQILEPAASETENDEVKKVQFMPEAFDVIGKHFGDGGKYFADLLEKIITRAILPEVWQKKKVWHWAIADDHTTIIFQDGQKLKIPF